MVVGDEFFSEVKEETIEAKDEFIGEDDAEDEEFLEEVPEEEKKVEKKEETDTTEGGFNNF